MMIAVKKDKFIVLFITIFGTLSFAIDTHLYAGRCAGVGAHVTGE